MPELNQALDKGTVIMKIERLEGCIQGMKDDIETFGGCSEDYQKIRGRKNEIQRLKVLLPTNDPCQN